jgi:glycosyltransferase involved in cell wall biosynthesis
MNTLPTHSISIITATYNAAFFLPRLIDSLIKQTDQDFQWVVVDGGSTDESLNILQNAQDKLRNVLIVSRPDFGIYDALNRGVKLSESDYYVVLGADDQLLPHGVEALKEARGGGNYDLVTCKYLVADRISAIRMPRWEFLYSQFAHVTGHAVGLLIRKDLHRQVGYYSKKFPIAADQLFILLAIRNGATVHLSDAIVGRFGVDGVSHMDVVGTLSEIFRVNVYLGHNMYVQLLLLALRLFKHRSKVIRFKG